MGLLFLILLGAILGWLAAIVLDGESRSGLIRNIGAGIAGALAAGLLISPLVGGGSLLGESYSIAALLLSLAGSLVVIAGANLCSGLQLRYSAFGRARARPDQGVSNSRPREVGGVE